MIVFGFMISVSRYFRSDIEEPRDWAGRSSRYLIFEIPLKGKNVRDLIKYRESSSYIRSIVLISGLFQFWHMLFGILCTSLSREIFNLAKHIKGKGISFLFSDGPLSTSSQWLLRIGQSCVDRWIVPDSCVAAKSKLCRLKHAFFGTLKIFLHFC